MFKYTDPNQFKVGSVDAYGNYLIELPDHHVYLDERGFFSKIMWGDREKQEKDAKVESFSILYIIHTLEIVKEITEIEMCKFELWELY